MFLLFYARVTFLISELNPWSKIATDSIVHLVREEQYIYIYIYKYWSPAEHLSGPWTQSCTILNW